MIKRIQLLLIIGFNLFLQQHASGQAGQQYLYKVGILDSLYSETLKESREIYVQVPVSYNPEKDQKYPVVFILDGEMFLPTVSNVHDYYSGGYIPEMIIVGISNANHRTRDLTTSTITTKYGMPFKDLNGEAANFSRFLGKELIPFIENKYPVTNFRTLIGHSYGGLFAIYSLMNQPELFTNYLVIDPSLDWDEQKLLKQAEDSLVNKNYENKAMFMSLNGQLHMQNSKITLENVMQDTTDYTLFARSNISFSNAVKNNKNNGLSFEWKFYPRDIHGTIPFASIMDGLISLFQWYQMENTDKINAFDTPKEELLNMINYRAEKLNNHFGYQVPPYPEELLNMCGYMNMDMEQPEKAKIYFEKTIQFYPKSANAFDSMADYYESQNDIQKALQFVTKAYELSGSDIYKKRMEDLKNK